MPEKRPKEREEPSVTHPAQSVHIGTIEFSAERDQIVPAMFALQEELSSVPQDAVAEVYKDGKFVYKYNYTSFPKLLESLVPAMHRHDMLLMCGAGGAAAMGVTACAMHLSGQWAQTTVPMLTSGVGQAVGSGVSFGKRYGVLALFGLASTDDDGLLAQRSMEPDEPEPETFTNDMLFALPEDHQKIITLLGWTVGKCKPLLAKFVDDTGTVDRKAALAYLNRQLEQQDQEAGR